MCAGWQSQHELDAAKTRGNQLQVWLFASRLGAVALADVGGIVFLLAGAGCVFRQHAVHPFAQIKRPNAGIVTAGYGLADVCSAMDDLAGVDDHGSGSVVAPP